MYASLLFDVEDYTTPGRHGLDDIPKWMAEIMTEEKVIGTFLVIGGKARSLAARGRHDVLRAMARHEIGSHTDNGSHHPTLCEYLAGLDWDKGVSLCREKEMRHVRELAGIFGTEIACLSRHGGNFAAQHVRVGAETGLPYLYSLATVPPQEPGWYCGTLNFGHELYVPEKSYGRPRDLDKVIARLDTEIREAAAAGYAWHGLFLAHPLMVKAVQFTDALNYADGRTRQPWSLPDFAPAREVAEARRGFRRVIRFLRDHEKLQCRPLGEVARQFSGRIPRLSRAELIDYAAQADRDRRIPDRELVSAAELVLAWAEIVARSRGGLPPSVPVRAVLGPTEEPQRWTDLREISWPALQRLAATLVAHAARTGCLPGNLALPGASPANRIGLGAVFFVLAKAVCALAVRKARRVAIEFQYPRYPAMAMEIDARARWQYLHWCVFDLEMPMDALCRYARLQAWTCKRPIPAASVRKEITT